VSSNVTRLRRTAPIIAHEAAQCLHEPCVLVTLAGRDGGCLAAACRHAAGEPRYDLAFAIRVGALDGRHPETGWRAPECIARALVPGGRLFIDGCKPLRKLALRRE
jgi:hypothetical protein